MDEAKQKSRLLLKPYMAPIVVILILVLITIVVFICYQRINQQFCEERLRTLEAVSTKITLSTYTRFDVQWTSLNYSVKILQAMEDSSENDLFDELDTIEDSLGLTESDGMLYLFDDKGYYYGNKGKIGRWSDQKILQTEQKYSLSVTNLPKQETHLGDFMMFFYRMKEPKAMDGIIITHVALARDIAIFDDDLEIGNYGDLDSSYIIRKNGTRIYHQSNNEIFTNVYNVVNAFDNCQFEHGVTKESIKQDIMRDKSGSAHMVYKGEDYIIAYQPIGIENWYAVYIVSLNSMSHDTREFIMQTVLLIGLAGITLLFLCILLINTNNFRWRIKQRAINDQLRAAMKEAKRASSAKSDFLSRMSHDIRTPLNGIIGMTDIAKKNIEHPEKVDECLQKIDRSSDHLMSLINDVLDMSKIESGKIEVRSLPFNLQNVLGECACMIEWRAAEQNILFQCDYSGIEHFFVQGDENHLKQILINILENAVKFTPNGGSISLCASEIGIEDSAYLYCFEITDTGIGMSAEYLEHVFEPFSQENNGARTSYKGTGLGMSIVKELVEKMHGRIQVESQKDKGSRFTVFMPFCAAPEKIPISTQKQTDSIQHQAHGKVLLAEDGAINREIAEYLLNDAGISFVSVENGQQAVEAFSASEPGEFDAILMDIMMPVMDGLEATRLIRASERPDAKTISIIAMTANAYREDEEKSLKAGMNAHLTKPLHPDEIIRVLKNIIK